jgi:long-chain acyl-CoA synthetase
VMITHRNLVSNVRAMIEVVPIEPRYRLLSLLPLSHMFEQAVGLGAALRAARRSSTSARCAPTRSSRR